MSLIEQNLQQAGFSLPDVAKPLAVYVPAVRSENLIFTSGQLPSVNGVIKTGKLGADLSVEDGAKAAQDCVLNCLAAVKALLGSLDEIEQIVKVVGYVNSTPTFTQQPQVVNGASLLLGTVFGSRGEHCRSAVGVASLPMDACVEIELTVRVKTN